MDQIHLMALDAALEDETTGGSLAVRVPAFPYDIYDLQRLGRVADERRLLRENGRGQRDARG